MLRKQMILDISFLSGDSRNVKKEGLSHRQIEIGWCNSPFSRLERKRIIL